MGDMESTYGKIQRSVELFIVENKYSSIKFMAYEKCYNKEIRDKIFIE